MEPKTYPSKVDKWLLVVLGVAAVITLLSVGPILFTEFEVGMLVVTIVILLLGLGLPGWVIANTRYTFEGDVLQIVSGPFQWRVPLREVRNVTPTRNPLSSPALSLDRLRIEYGDRSIMISPRDKEGFLRELESRCGRLQR